MSSIPLTLLAAETEDFLLPEEVVMTPLAQEGNIEWLLGRHDASGETFVLATAASEDAVFHVTQLLKNELSLRDKLSGQWSVKPIRHTYYHGRYALIYPAFNYRTLAGSLFLLPESIHDFLNRAVMLCTALSLMHQQGIVHGDVKPANFYFADGGEFRLGGFGLAMVASDPQQQNRLPVTGGTLAYMSPEHTSRTPHRISNRSDLYSLGIVLYELLTGKLPFGHAEEGHAEWVHHHIASEPEPPHLLRKDVPVVLSSIILRLLAKPPEARYQTAEGLLADLCRCQSNLMPGGNLDAFALGLQDSQPAGLVSDALYVDHPQVADVLAAYEDVYSSGKHALVAIGGAQGSGKSSLIASSVKVLQQKKALLTVVKADQHSPVLPYAVFTSAFRSLALHLLGLPSGDMARWKLHIARTLGDYAGFAVSLVPELGVLLDRKAKLPFDAYALDVRDKFNVMACSLVKAFTAPGRPLVMLIDDVHWADRATLQLLQNLLNLSEDLPLLLIISHRDPVSLPCPDVAANLVKICSAAARKVTITPEPLSVKSIARWLASLFHTRSSVTTELAQLIHEKTDGNPLFTHEFYRQAVRDGLITHHMTKWAYDRNAIKVCHYAENVTSGVLQQLQTLSPAVRNLLGKVACLGGSGELLLLSKILAIPVGKIKVLLAPAVTARLITFSGDEYAFMHDRMHEAALDLISADEKDVLHCQAAHQLAGMTRETVNQDPLFRAVHHIASVKNVSLILADAEQFCELILQATKRAKLTGDYVSSLRFLQTAHNLNAQINANENFELLLEEAECEFLNGNLTTAFELCSALLSAPGELTDKAVAACLMAEIHMRQSDGQLALETAVAWLAVFGIQLSRNPDKEECDAARIILKEDVGKNPYSRFRSLPLVTCRHTEAVMNLMASASIFAAFINPRLQFMILCKLLHLTLARGMTGASTFALSWYGVLCGDHYAEYSRGFASTLLARQLVYKYDFASYKARTLLPLDQVSIWTMPLTYAIDRAKATFDVAVENGDRTSACLALRHIVMNYLARGDHLDGVQTSIERGLTYVRKAQYRDVEAILQMQRDYVLFLRRPGIGPFTGDDFIPPALHPSAPVKAVEPLLLMQFWALLYKGMAHFFAGEYIAASRYFTDAAPLTEFIPGHIHLLDFHLYSALALSIPLTKKQFSTEVRSRFMKHAEKIALWCTENAKTFSDKEALLQAELLRLEGETARAAEQYETAMTLSREGQFHHIHGVACELAARFAAASGLKFAADAYIRGAMNAWALWGAEARLRQLETLYPHLVTQSKETALNTISFKQNALISDLQSMVTAIRALTEEINLDRLINILMVMLVERAGAQHCLLIRLINGNIPEIQARATTNAEGIKVKVVKETPLATDLPLSVLTAVIRTGQEIRTGKPEVFSPFSQDHYLVASGAAVMCVPMFKQAQMVGVLYLENRLIPDVFTAEHSRIVSMLGAQAAVSLETARLYAELLDENIQRRRVEKQLRASQTSLMLGEKISHTGTWHWHLEPDIQLISDEYKRIMGLPDEQTSTSMAEFQSRVHPDDIPSLRELIETSVRKGSNMQAEFRIIRSDGECRYIKGIGEPVDSWPETQEYFGTLTDITHQRMSEDAVRIAQADLARVSRATTVGQLTSSIAHEINQPLMSIVTNAGASLRWLKRDPLQLEKARESIEEIIREGSRAGNIIRGLQALTRNQVSKFTHDRLHMLALDILSLSRLELERRFVALELDLRADNDHIFCERVQVQQVLLNLVMNGIDAMVDNVGSRVLRLTSFNPSADLVRFEVADNGTGLSEDVIGKIFDSFYTTKAEGMGMGLTISDDIIKRHGGTLSACNRKSGGSLFWFTLPVEPEKPS
ncbi:trifunctional serine/threonine-protein kinase/ATP-binding protein/sensor histidine kinase [Pantoea sp. FN060301]|uniref:trifunctional serine/threonine-protein kinase/ATP-binding protein/sensor histidine kinase n=1 Tax=Pantoea sp. FN060301 TaxID=3420380 RepID=UPI003D184802